MGTSWPPPTEQPGDLRAPPPNEARRRLSGLGVLALAATLLTAHAVADFATKTAWPLLRSAAAATARRLRSGWREAPAWRRRAHVRAARGLETAGWWLVWTLAIAIDDVGLAIRAAARADDWTTVGAIHLHRRVVQAQDHVALAAEVFVPRAWSWARPRAQAAARQLAAGLVQASGRVRGRRLGRRLAFAGVVAVAPAAGVLVFGVPAVHVAAMSVDVAVNVPGALPPLGERSTVVADDGSCRSRRSRSTSGRPSSPLRTAASTSTRATTSWRWLARSGRTSRTS